MFTETDYREYFTALKEADEQMRACLEGLLSEVTDTDVREVLSAIKDDEVYHLKLEDELFRILDLQPVNAGK
ncbi:MAG: hypothetical protein WC476_01785 [Phycisphaerae bacterium]|jgi:rubrerythrin